MQYKHYTRARRFAALGLAAPSLWRRTSPMAPRGSRLVEADMADGTVPATSGVLLLQVRHRVKVVTASSDSDWLTRLLAACTESCHTLNPIFLFAAIHWLAGLHHEL